MNDIGCVSHPIQGPQAPVLLPDTENNPGKIQAKIKLRRGTVPA